MVPQLWSVGSGEEGETFGRGFGGVGRPAPNLGLPDRMSEQDEGETFGRAFRRGRETRAELERPAPNPNLVQGKLP